METLAVLFGGPSSEYSVALDTMHEFLKYVDRNKRKLVFIGITKTGAAFLYKGSEDAIWGDTWENEEKYELFARFAQSRQFFWRDADGISHELKIDRCLPLMHGTYGEDGTIQGFMEALGVPVIGCGIAASAVGYDKDLSHKVAEAAGVAVPKSVVYLDGIDNRMDVANEVSEKLGYPVYVKPARGGSSIGITKVDDSDGLDAAINLAVEYDEKVVIEENIVGVEVGLAVIGKKKLILGEVDQVNTVDHFFSFEDKYVSDAESPIQDSVDYDQQTAEKIKRSALAVYRALDGSGFSRIDLFLGQDGVVYFNEINTIPWLPDHGRFSKMLIRAGLSMEEIVESIITAE